MPAREWAHRSFWVSLGFFMYSEAAALLRLSDLPFVPKLRAIDLAGRTLYVDYIPGENLRSLAARGGAAVHDADIKDDPRLCGVSARDLERREVELLDRAGIGDFRREIAEMAREINARGVVPLDIKLGNFIRGASSGRRTGDWRNERRCTGDSSRWTAVETEDRRRIFAGPGRIPAHPGNRSGPDHAVHAYRYFAGSAFENSRARLSNRRCS